MLFKLPYYIANGGDGSVSLRLCPTLKDAMSDDKNQYENWAEASADTLTLKYEKGQLFYGVSRYDKAKKKHVFDWTIVPDENGDICYSYRLYGHPEWSESGKVFQSKIKDLDQKPDLWEEECPYSMSGSSYIEKDED